MYFFFACNVLHCTFSNIRLDLHHQGYSSLRFRPIRHLSSPVEDLEMCKVVGVTDKVRETFTSDLSQYHCFVDSQCLLWWPKDLIPFHSKGPDCPKHG